MQGVLLAAALATLAGVPVAGQGKTRLTTTLGGHRVSAMLETHEVAIGSASQAPPEHRNSSCTYSRIPCALLDRLDIQVDGRPLALPRSAVADLADIDRAELRQVGPGRYQLRLECGDASESYEAQLVFDSRRLRERTVIASEAGQVAEHTVYYEVSLPGG